MSVKISYSKKINKLKTNTIFFVNEKFSINNLKTHISSNEYSYISDLLKNIDMKKNIFVFEVNSKRKIVLISIKKNLKSSDIENLGAEFLEK